MIRSMYSGNGSTRIFLRRNEGCAFLKRGAHFDLTCFYRSSRIDVRSFQTILLGSIKKNRKVRAISKKVMKTQNRTSKILRSKNFDFHFHTISSENFRNFQDRKFSKFVISKIFIENCMKMKIEVFRSQNFSRSNFRLS